MSRRSRGFSLIELMIAVTLGMLAVAAVGSVFIYGSRSYKEDDKIARMQDELRFAMAQFTQDLEMAGFYAQIRNPADDIDVAPSAASLGEDCGALMDFEELDAAIFTHGNADAEAANDSFPCITTAEFYPGPGAVPKGTDIIAIKRLSGTAVNVANLLDTRAYLKTNGVQSLIFYGSKGGDGIAPISGAITHYEYKPSIWYIRRYAQDVGPQVPSLCRKYLNGGRMVTECLAQGIEDLQLEFGFDEDGNGVADFFVEYSGLQSDPADLARITAARVHLLARAAEPDVDYLNKKTYVLGTTTHEFGDAPDKYHRRSIASIVLLRNPTNMLTPLELPQ